MEQPKEEPKKSMGQARQLTERETKMMRQFITDTVKQSVKLIQDQMDIYAKIDIMGKTLPRGMLLVNASGAITNLLRHTFKDIEEQIDPKLADQLRMDASRQIVGD